VLTAARCHTQVHYGGLYGLSRGHGQGTRKEIFSLSYLAAEGDLAYLVFIFLQKLSIFLVQNYTLCYPFDSSPFVKPLFRTHCVRT
jgi:hypothetical protein